MIKLIKKSLIISLTLLMLFGSISTASAAYYTTSGTTATSFLTSDFILFYPCYNWTVYEQWVYDIYYGKYAVDYHLHEGVFKDADNYPFDQSMDNTLNFRNSNGTTFDIIYFWEWQSRDIFIDWDDQYFPGEKSEQVLLPLSGDFFWTWSWFLDEGWGGTTKYVYSSYLYDL